MTVFLALLLSAFLGVTGILLEFARAQTLSAQLQAAVSAGAESVFAGYYAPLFGRYQLMARHVPEGDAQALEEETLEYINAWGTGSGTGSRIRLAGFRAQEAAWSNQVYMTDDWGAVFREMASRSMQAQAAEILASFWQEHLGLEDADVIKSLQSSHSEKDVTPAAVLPDYKSLQESLQEADETEKAEEEKAKEEEKKQEEAVRKAVEAGKDPPTVKRPSAKELQEKRQKKKERAKGKKFLELLDAVRKILSKGLLAAVMPEGKRIPEGSVPSGGLPSSLSAAVKGRASGGSGGSTLLFREYLMRNMDCFTSETEKRPVCELEYLIAGKKTDRKNLDSTVKRLLAIRLGLNLVHLSRSLPKKTAAKEAAILAVGWTGQVPLIEAVTGLLLTAWAAAESLGDVRTLLDGGRVVLLKTEEDWNLSLEGAAKGWRTADSGDGTDSLDKGLSYEDYLRICLYLSSAETLSYRGMDVIQWNLASMDSGFRMQHCVVEGDLTAGAMSRVLFRPLYGAAVRGSGGTILLEKKSRFSYRAGG